MRHRIIGACAVALGLVATAACAKDELAGVKSVAIISAIGDCLYLPNVFADNDAYVDGIGIAYEPGTFSGDARMYAFFRIKVIDARTLKILASEPAKLPKTGWLPRWPTLDVDTGLWPGTSTPMSEAQKAKARPLMLGLLHDAVAQTLKNMELAQ